MNARRSPSFDRAASSCTMRDDAREICPDEQILLAEVAGPASIQGTASQGGDDQCSTDQLLTLLGEIAFDTLGAARFIRSGNVGFARQSVASALAELTVAAARLGVA